MNKIQMMMFKGYLSQLVQKAREDADPGLYAEIILDNLDDEKIAFFLTGPNGIENLINVDPAVSTVRPWFERLRTEVSAMLTDDDESAMVEETQPEPVNHNDGAELPTSDS